MTLRLGITGHQRLPNPSDWLWVQTELDTFLSQMPRPLLGFTSLASGTDQLFAEAVRKQGGSFTAIIPFADYEFKFAEGQDRYAYNRLLAQAAEVEIIHAPGSNRESYFRAGKQIVHRSEILVAVWDGKAAAGLGGTADVVSYARHCGKPVHHIDPISRIVTELSHV